MKDKIQIIKEKMMKTITNFREYGVYYTTNGRKIKSGKLYRSANLFSITTDEIQYLKQIGIGTIMDFREEGEVASHPDPVIEGIKYINVAASSFDMKEIKHEKEDRDYAFSRSKMLEVYKELPFNNKAYACFFDLLLHTDQAVIHHCAAGKDRAGIAAALVLLLLGVSREDVMDDYLKTNENIRAIVTLLIGRDDAYDEVMATMKDAFVVDEEYLNGTLDAILGKYDSFKEFFLKEYGITEEIREVFKEKYLEV